LTPEEQELANKYKAGSHPLTFTTDRNGYKMTKDTINSLLSGRTEALNDVIILLSNEMLLKMHARILKYF